MHVNMGKDIAALPRLTVKELRLRYAEVFGETTNAGNKDWLVRRIAWRMQALAEGGLSDRARQRAGELANDADLRLMPPKATREPVRLPAQDDQRLPVAGSIITREYKGTLLQVKVLEQGFEFEGGRYKSLSAVAKAVTGQHCNGYHFFRLGKEAR